MSEWRRRAASRGNHPYKSFHFRGHTSLPSSFQCLPVCRLPRLWSIRLFAASKASSGLSSWCPQGHVSGSSLVFDCESDLACFGSACYPSKAGCSAPFLWLNRRSSKRWCPQCKACFWRLAIFDTTNTPYRWRYRSPSLMCKAASHCPGRSRVIRCRMTWSSSGQLLQLSVVIHRRTRR